MKFFRRDDIPVGVRYLLFKGSVLWLTKDASLPGVQTCDVSEPGIYVSTQDELTDAQLLASLMHCVDSSGYL